MNYYMVLISRMNARRTPDASLPNVIRVLPAGTRVEGDELSADGRFLNVLLIDGLQVAESTWIATYTTNGKLETYPPPVDPGLAVQVELTFVSKSPVLITLNGVPVGQEQYNGVIVIAPVG